MPQLLIYKYAGKPSKEVTPEIAHDQETGISVLVMPGYLQIVLSDKDGFVHAMVKMSSRNGLQIATTLAEAVGVSDAMADVKAGATPSKSENLH